jgi:hypothetical protein
MGVLSFIPMDNNGSINIDELLKKLGGGSGNGAVTSRSSERSTSTSSDVTIYSLNQVRNIATNAFGATLGRAPTDQELNTFVTSLNAFSKKNPQKTARTASGTSGGTDTTKSSTKGDKVTKTGSSTSTTTSSSTTSGGVDVGGFLQGQLENTAEARAVKVDDIFRGAMSFLADKIGG